MSRSRIAGYDNSMLNFLLKYNYNLILVSGIQHSDSVFLQIILH